MRGIAAGLLGLVLGCGGRSPYQCASSDQCVDQGVSGVCEPQGFCSFPDPSCFGGRKFEPNAGGGLAGACVDVDASVARDAPPPACGVLGEACCASAPACVDDTYCSAGTCQACVVAVAPGRHSNCLVKYDHTVWCAGENEVGELGIGIAGVSQSSWMQVHDTTGAAITDAVAAASGYELTCAIRSGGTVWCWGGIGGPAANQTKLTTNQPLTNIVEIGAGYSHVCGRDMTGGVWCWGENNLGQLGDNTTTTRYTAAPVLAGAAPLTGALSLSVGGHHNCVREAGDVVLCWGKNTAGELGDGSVINRLVPTQVSAAISVATGLRNTCSLHADHTVWCSGETWRNRIGNAIDLENGITPGRYTTPQQVMTGPGMPLVGATAVAMGGDGCIVMSDTTVQCWGSNMHGQTGFGAGAAAPASVLTTDGKPLDQVDQVATRGPLACAHRTTGEWRCWGRNLEGAFGDGTFANHALATPLRFTCP